MTSKLEGSCCRFCRQYGQSLASLKKPAHVSDDEQLAHSCHQRFYNRLQLCQVFRIDRHQGKLSMSTPLSHNEVLLTPGDFVHAPQGEWQ